MVSETVLRATTERITLGLLVIALGNLLGGFFGGVLGLAGILVYVVVAVPALYLGVRELVRGAGVFVDGVADERLGPAPDSTARDPTLVITEALREIASPPGEADDGGGGDATERAETAGAGSADAAAQTADDADAAEPSRDDADGDDTTDADDIEDADGDDAEPVTEDTTDAGEATGADPDPTADDTAPGTTDDRDDDRSDDRDGS